MLSRVLSVCLMRSSLSSMALRFLAILRRLRSMPTNSSPALVSASLMIFSGSPVFLASSKANELPGSPISSLKSGAMFCTSNIIAPLITPVSPDDA